MANTSAFPLEGGCSCRGVRYRMQTAPLVVNACHCSWCQRETGSAFVVNALLEHDRLELLSDAGSIEVIDTPSASGRGQRIARCRSCKVALWSHYPGGGDAIAFVRVGTLDMPDAAPPDLHIFTDSKQKWLELPANARAFPGHCDPRVEWGDEAIQRFRAAKASVGEESRL